MVPWKQLGAYSCSTCRILLRRQPAQSWVSPESLVVLLYVIAVVIRDAISPPSRAVFYGAAEVVHTPTLGRQ